MALPPGPPLPGLVQAGLLIAQPLPFLLRCQRAYGDVFTIRAASFGTFVVVAGPEQVRAVFSAPPDVLRAGESNAPLGPLVGERSVLLLDGREHLRQRKLLLPPFHGDRMRAWGAAIERATVRELESWPVGRSFALLPSMREVTLEVIVRTVFGVREAARHAELAARLRTVLEPVGSQLRVTLSLLSGGTIGDGGAGRDFQRKVAAVDALLFAEIAARREAPDLERREDILSTLLLARDEEGAEMTDREVRDELMTLLVAGHETTATALAWAFERILRHEEVLRELERTLAAQDTGYLEAVVRETLRLRPILPNVGRMVASEWTLGEWTIPPGVGVLPSISLLHRREDLYPEPEAFRPERFLGRRPDGYAWIPFGGGTRRCLGASFAEYEMRTVIRTVLALCDLAPADPAAEPVGRQGITLVPDAGARVIQRRAPVVPARRSVGERRDVARERREIASDPALRAVDAA